MWAWLLASARDRSAMISCAIMSRMDKFCLHNTKGRASALTALTVTKCNNNQSTRCQDKIGLTLNIHKTSRAVAPLATVQVRQADLAAFRARINSSRLPTSRHIV